MRSNSQTYKPRNAEADIDATVLSGVWHQRTAAAVVARQAAAVAFGQLRYCDHVLVDRVTKPHTRVETVCDVLQAVVDVELDLDVGILVQQQCDLGQERGSERMVTTGDAHRAGQLVTQLDQLIQLRLDFVNETAQLLQLEDGESCARSCEG